MGAKRAQLTHLQVIALAGSLREAYDEAAGFYRLNPDGVQWTDALVAKAQPFTCVEPTVKRLRFDMFGRPQPRKKTDDECAARLDALTARIARLETEFGLVPVKA